MLGIPIAAAGAVLLALGTLFQHKGIDDEGAAQGRPPEAWVEGRPQALLGNRYGWAEQPYLVAALAKTVIARLFQSDFEWLNLTCLTGSVVAA